VLQEAAGKQHAAQDLAGRRLRDRVDELDRAHLLVRRDLCRDEAISSSALAWLQM
jgi:hypothetical protein